MPAARSLSLRRRRTGGTTREGQVPQPLLHPGERPWCAERVIAALGEVGLRYAAQALNHSDQRRAVVELGGQVVPGRAGLSAAFPQYTVNVLLGRGERPRIEVVSKDGRNPYCLISDDACEIWRELRNS